MTTFECMNTNGLIIRVRAIDNFDAGEKAEKRFAKMCQHIGHRLDANDPTWCVWIMPLVTLAIAKATLRGYGMSIRKDNAGVYHVSTILGREVTITDNIRDAYTTARYVYTWIQTGNEW